jgi:lipopolysaccharide biosynthesis glycosyltransferase
MNKNKIPIFFAVDDCYIPFLAVTLESLVNYRAMDNDYIIYVLFTSVLPENQEKIMKYERENVSIKFVNVEEYFEKFLDKFYTRDYFSQTTYFRLFIPDIFLEYDKGIYLDSDTILLDDVAKLYNEDIGDNLIGAVPDGAVQSTREFQEYVELVIGMKSYKNYFNAGVLVMNLKALREFRFKLKFLYLLDTVKYRVAQDQDYLNRLCKGRVKILDNSWNVMPAASSSNRAENAKLVHFNLSNKPWHLDNIAYDEYFWDFAKKTVFYDKICSIKKCFTDEQRKNEIQTGLRLVELAQKEADCVGDDRKV